MNTEQFHTSITDLFRKHILATEGPAPLDWNALPSDIAKLCERALLEALEESRSSVFGAPFSIDTGQLFGTELRPNTDAVLSIDLNLFKDGDYTDYSVSGVKFNLADAILTDAETGERGSTVANAIEQLERTIARLKDEAAKRGWELSD